MSGIELNLAARPFANAKPIWRLAVLLWVVGVGLVALDVWLYTGYFSGANQTRNEETAQQAAFEEENEKLRELEAALEGVDLGAQNQRASFINDRIEERTFRWGQLLDRLGEAMTAESRVTSLSPRFGDREGKTASRRGAGLGPGEVLLEIRGAAANGVEVLALLDRLFRHPNFRSPDLSQEAVRDTYLEYALTVIYLPHAEPAQEDEEAPVEAQEAGLEESGDDEGGAEEESAEGGRDS